MQVVYVKVDSAVVTLPGGTPWTLVKGQHYPADDPVVKANPGMFSADARYGAIWTSDVPPAEMAEPPVEQATAGPGERRNTRRA